MKSLQAAILKNKRSELSYAIASGNEQRKAQLLADIARLKKRYADRQRIAMNNSLGNYIARLHDQAVRETIVFVTRKERKCHYGNHQAALGGGKYIGRMWCCAKCLEVVK